MSEWIVDTAWLNAHLDAPDVVIVDGSWYMPADERDPKQEFLNRRIPGAVFFDIDEIADHGSNLPHMLPPPEMFASRMRKLGIGDGMRVVVYDTAGLFSAARVWWTFRVMGHNDVAVLDGGLPKWIVEDRPLEAGPPRPRQERHFTARLNTMMVRDRIDVADASSTGSAQIVDARSAARFTGEVAEPRPGLRGGHIPGSRNVPYDSVLTSNRTIRPRDEIRAVFAEAGVDLGRPVVTSCGSGITAAVLALALAVAGRPDTSLYDGSWTEWGGDADLPVETGRPVS